MGCRNSHPLCFVGSSKSPPQTSAFQAKKSTYPLTIGWTLPGLPRLWPRWQWLAVCLAADLSLATICEAIVMCLRCHRCEVGHVIFIFLLGNPFSGISWLVLGQAFNEDPVLCGDLQDIFKTVLAKFEKASDSFGVASPLLAL